MADQEEGVPLKNPRVLSASVDALISGSLNFQIVVSTTLAFLKSFSQDFFNVETQSLR